MKEVEQRIKEFNEKYRIVGYYCPTTRPDLLMPIYEEVKDEPGGSIPDESGGNNESD
jgi:hypothetical protein